MHWEVYLIGDTADLQTLSEAMCNGDILISRREDRYILQAKELDALHDVCKVRTRVEEIVTFISGASQLILGASTAIKVGLITQFLDDDKRRDILQVEPATVEIRVFSPSYSISHAEGTVEHHHPGDPIQKWLKVVEKDQKITKALRLRNAGKLNWVELYRIYEVVEGDVGKNHIVGSGWATGTEITRFTRTANSVAVSGDQARHGEETTQPPPNPIDLQRSQELIDVILRLWITSKAEKLSS